MPPEEDSAAHLDVVRRDAERVEAPGHGEHDEEKHDDDQDREGREGQEPAREDVVDGIPREAIAVGQGRNRPGRDPLGEALTEVRDDDTGHRDDEDPAAQERGVRGCMRCHAPSLSRDAGAGAGASTLTGPSGVTRRAARVCPSAPPLRPA